MRLKQKYLLALGLGLYLCLQVGGICWSQVTERVSVDSAGGEGNNASTAPSISGDGGSVAFQSDADNLVAGDTNGAPDIFVDELQVGAGQGGGSGDGNSGGGCFIATAAYECGISGEVR